MKLHFSPQKRVFYDFIYFNADPDLYPITNVEESAARGRDELSECFLFPHVNIFFLGDNNSTSVGSETHTSTLCGETPLGLPTHAVEAFL